MDYQDYQAGQTPSIFWFKAKINLLEILLKKYSKPGEKNKILNLGCGTGDDIEALNNYGDVYLVDVNQKTLDLIPVNLCQQKVLADACSLPFADNSFDQVVLLDVFEHIANDNQAAKEIYRVLKPGGGLIFSVPAFQTLFSGHDRALNHQRRYSKKTLGYLLADFKNLKLNYWNCVFFLPSAIVRLVKNKAEAKVDNLKLPKIIDWFFLLFLKLENQLIKRGIPLPVGLTIVGYCQKKEN